MCVFVLIKLTSMYICIYVILYLCMYVCMYMCVCACMHVCMYVCTRVCAYVPMCVCMYVCMHVCRMCVRLYICVCMYTYISAINLCTTEALRKNSPVSNQNLLFLLGTQQLHNSRGKPLYALTAQSLPDEVSRVGTALQVGNQVCLPLWCLGFVT